MKMGFTFVLVLATLVAYTQATLTYGSRRTYDYGRSKPRVAVSRTYGGSQPRVGVVSGSLGRLGSGYKPTYDAGRLVHETVYNPRRVGVSDFGRGRLVDSHGHGGLAQSDCFPKCLRGEVCVRNTMGSRPYCQRQSLFQGGRSPVLGGSRTGGRRNACYGSSYPTDCVSNSRIHGVPRYTYYEGYCQEFTCDDGNRCRPQGHQNNIFSSRRDCDMYCRD